MNKKWYFNALIPMVIGILALFGANQENLVVPNQEVVLQFSSIETSSSEVQYAISNVKEKLETIGVSNIEVNEEASGRLVISYYSDVTVEGVKDIFSATALSVDYTSNKGNPSKLPIGDIYNLDVFEISKSDDSGFGSGGKLFFELKQDYDRFSNPNINVFASVFNPTEKNIEILVAYKQNKIIAIAINNIPHKIPEGRAGPLS